MEVNMSTRPGPAYPPLELQDVESTSRAASAESAPGKAVFGPGMGPPAGAGGEAPQKIGAVKMPDSSDSLHKAPAVDSNMVVGESVDVERRREGCFGWFVHLVSQYPFVISLILPIIVFIIIGSAGIPPYPAFIEGNRARNSLGAAQFDAYVSARDGWLDEVNLSPVIEEDRKYDPFTLEQFTQSINVWFESESNTILSDANLESQARILAGFVEISQDFCLRSREDPAVCRGAYSAMDFLGTTDPTQFRERLAAANDVARDRLKAYVGAATDLDAAVGSWTKARIPIGGPLPDYKNLTDREDDQGLVYEAEYKQPGFTGLPTRDGWIRKMELLVEEERKTNKDLKVRFSSFPMVGPVMFQALIRDALLAIGALFAVGIIMWVQVGSVLLSICGMAQIVISFVLTLSTWRIIGNESFTFIQILVIFIILGIGADDVFVFMDAWKQSRLQVRSISRNLTSRLAWTWTRSFTAMLVTTSTTIGALVLTSIIDVPSIATFGTFAAIVVAWNFFFCVVWFPNIVIIHDRYIIGCNDGCCAKRVCGCCCSKCERTWGLQKDTSVAANGEMNHEDLRWLEKFFKFTLHEFLSVPWKRYVVFFVFLGTAVAGIILAATQVTLTDKSLTESFLKEESDIQVMFNLLLGSSLAFQSTSDGRKRAGHVVYGIEKENPIDRTGTYALGEGDQIGTPIFSDHDLNSETFQNHLIETCDKIRGLDSLAVTIANKRPEVICFMSDFKAYREARGESFPVTPAGLVDALLAWRKNVCTVAAPGCFKNMNKTGVAQLDEDYDRNTGFLYDYDTKMIHMAFVSGNLSIPFLEQELQVIEPEYLEWKELGEQQNKDGFTPFAITDRTDWIMLMYTLINGVVSGVPLAVAVAFIVLVCATANWWVSLMASLTIMGIMSSFFITFVAMKGKLGYYECMFLQITVGMSVDYVVHLAHSYNMSPRKTKSEKMQDSLGEMGISVFSGAITTLAASGLLFACQFNIFFQYGSFIFFVILWSILWAMIMFPAMMIQFGPNGRSGDIPPIRYFHKMMCSGLEDMSEEGQDMHLVEGVRTAGGNMGSSHENVRVKTSVVTVQGMRDEDDTARCVGSPNMRLPSQ